MKGKGRGMKKDAGACSQGKAREGGAGCGSEGRLARLGRGVHTW